MSKLKRIIIFCIIIAAMFGLGYVAYFGIGAQKEGSAAAIKQGLDLAGGVSITYQVVGDENPSLEDMEDTRYKLQQRVEGYSTEAQVYLEGTDRINIEIPGVSDANAILEELGKPGSLYFISETDSNGNINYSLTVTQDGQVVYFDEFGQTFCYVGNTGVAVLYDEETNNTLLDENGQAITYDISNSKAINLHYHLNYPIEDLIANGSVVLSGSDVENAVPGQQQAQNSVGAKQNVVQLTFTKTGTDAFAAATQSAYTKSESIGIYFDGRFISVPNVSTPILDGQGVITGMASYEEADRLASNIRIGGLKLELEELRSQVVGAQLGSEAIRTSLLAGAIGFALVAVFMIAVYFLPGLSSALALVLYTFMMIIGISLFDLTLTLPGIAGIILSVGMAVDANVIVFARIREELATGKTLQSAVDIGFKKALSAILGGNITTFIAALVLMFMGTGSVKGFAQTLALGIVLSMFTALVVTKMILQGFMAMGLTSSKLYGVAKERKTFDFVSKGKIFLGISLAVILVGVVFMGVNKGKIGSFLNLSMEFKGGTSTNVVFNEDYSIEEIDANVVPYIEKITGDGYVQTQKVEGTNEVIIKTRTLSVEERDELNTVLNEEFGVAEGSITSETISATISNEMTKNSIISMAVAVICMLIYIWLRFSDYRFGISSVLALVHDVLIVIAFYAVVKVSVGSTFIACMLTIVGYSINATIVIFDRIRENRKLSIAEQNEAQSRRKKKGEKPSFDLKDIVNKSIGQTMSRSLFTSFTTFIMVVVLYFLGVTSIKEFALPLMVGILCGTYSSICLAGSFWYFFRNKFAPKNEDEED